MENESERPGLASAARTCPGPDPSLTFPGKMFCFDSLLHLSGSIPALCYVAIAVYCLCTVDAPIYARRTKFLYSFLLVTFCRWS